MEHNLGRRRGTVDKYVGVLERLARWFARPPKDSHLAPGGSDPLHASADDLERFAGPWAHWVGLTPRARRPVVAALRGFYRWAHQREYIDSDPAAALRYPEAGKKLPSAASLATAGRLMMAPDIDTFIGIRDAAVLATLIGCGLRLSGLVGLNEGDLVWTRDGRDRERLILRVREKGDRERLVPVPVETALLIRAYLAHEELEGVDRSLPDGDRVLWISTRNRTVPPHEYHGERRRIATRTVADMIERYGSRAGIPPNERHPHALRHLYGTELGEADIDLIQRAALLGHAGPDSTAVYTQLAQRKLMESVDRANPMGKLRTPITDRLRELARTTAGA